MKNYWGQDDIRKLKKLFNSVSNIELTKAFPDRTFIAIYKKAYNLGLRKESSIEFLNRSDARKGEKSPAWKGGRKKSSKGYIQILMPEHPRADPNGYVLEHTVVFEKETGISVPSNCVVHHLNGNKMDNRIENLCLMSFSAHSTYHNNKRWKNE